MVRTYRALFIFQPFMHPKYTVSPGLRQNPDQGPPGRKARPVQINCHRRRRRRPLNGCCWENNTTYRVYVTILGLTVCVEIRYATGIDHDPLEAQLNGIILEVDGDVTIPTAVSNFSCHQIELLGIGGEELPVDSNDLKGFFVNFKKTNYTNDLLGSRFRPKHFSTSHSEHLHESLIKPMFVSKSLCRRQSPRGTDLTVRRPLGPDFTVLY